MITLQRKLLAGLVGIFVLVSGTMLYDSARSTPTEVDSTASEKTDRSADWRLPPIEGSGDGTTPVIKGARTVGLVTDRAIASLSFVRPSTGRSLVRAKPFLVGDGVSADVLRRVPGRYPQTAGLGEPGNIAIAGHRTGWTAPFRRINDLRQGDHIILQSPNGERFEYEVVRKFVTNASDLSVLDQSPRFGSDFIVTLTTGEPLRSSERRLIIQGVLVTTS